MSSRGIQRERQVRALLEESGWWVCRAAGSLGDADLVALRGCDIPMLIEVKSAARGPYHGFGPADRAELSEAAERAGAEAWLVWWPSRQPARWIPETHWPNNTHFLEGEDD